MRGKKFFILLLFGLGIINHDSQGQDLSLSLKENKGQWPENVRFKGEIGCHSVWLENTRITYQLVNEKLHPLQQLHDSRHGEKPSQSDKLAHVFRVNFENALSTYAQPASTPEQTKYNYYLTSDEKKWATGVNAFSSVVYKKLYRGIDLKVYGSKTFLKYDLELEPGVNGSQIKFQYEGLENIELKNGILRLKTSLGNIEERIPKAYQLVDGISSEVECAFTLKGNTVGFSFPKPLNPRYKTIIDPLLLFFTYSGSQSDNWANSAISDRDGNSFTAGTVYGSSYPTTVGAFDRTYNGGSTDPYLAYDIGILKFNAAGSQLLTSTFIGGSGAETPHSLALDIDQNLIILGSTASSNFPTTTSAYQRTFKGGPREYPYGTEPSSIYPSYVLGSDIFLFKLKANGQTMLASTLIGGNGTDGLMNVYESLVTNYGDQFRGDVIVGADNSVYVASNTHSNNFPVVQGFQASLRGLSDGVVFKMNSTLSQLEWSTYYGGSSDDAFYSIQLVGNDKVAVCGGTLSSDFPTPGNAYQNSRLGTGIDAAVVVLSASNGQRLHSTYSSTASYDQAYIVQADAQQNIYIFGQTQGSMPKSANTYGRTNGGQFIQKFNSSLTQLLWGTTFGSKPFTPNISPTAFSIDTCNRLFLAGWGGRVNYFGTGFAGGYTEGLPITSDALQSTSPDSSDFYFMVLGADAMSLVYATYFGSRNGRGEHVDGGTSRFDKNGIITQAVCGCRDGGNNFFVGTPGSYRPNIGSNNCNNGVLKINLFDLKVDFNFNGQLQCPATLTLFNNSQNGESYVWYFGNGDSLASNNSTITYKYNKPGKYQISLKAFNPKTCTQVAISSDSIFIPNPFPFPSRTIDDKYCIGDTLFPSFPEFAGYNVNWTPNLYLSNPSIANPLVFPLSSVKYNVTIKDQQGCLQTSFFQTRNKEINLGFGYEKEFTPCDGIYKIKYFSNRDTSDSYIWYFENGDTATGPTVTRTYSANGRYPVRLFGGRRNCNENAIDTISLFDQKTIIIPSFSTINLFKNCNQPVVQFNNSTINAKAFQWDFGDGTNSTEPSTEHIFPDSGVYQIKLLAINEDCISELKKEIKVERFFVPNLITLNNDSLNSTLKIKGLQPGCKLDIYNRWGKSVYSTKDYKNDWNAQNLDEGTYFYNITFPEGFGCHDWIHALKPKE